jgi:hypothetical protein
MPYCSNCGTEVSQFAANCPNCGAPQRNQAPVKNHVVDNGGFGWGLLGFCVPIAGLILFLVWNSERPRTAKAAGMGALISVIAGVVFYIIYFIAIFAFMDYGYY